MNSIAARQTPESQPLIELRDVGKRYLMGEVEVPALDGVSLTVKRGEFIAVMGPSGSGKSTLMNVLGLLDVPDKGSYRLEGMEVARHSEDELCRIRSRVVGFVFQQFNLLARTTALENVALPGLYTTGRLDYERAAALLGELGLDKRLNHTPAELSGGQQQRVAIARSLFNRPSILFADEPTGNLDSASERDIMAILERLNSGGMTVVLVTHEEEIAAHARRIIRMRDGRIQSDEVSAAGTTAVTIVSPAYQDLPGPGRLAWLPKLLSYCREAFRTLSANKVRAALSTLGILIGVAAVVAMVALGSGAKQSVESQLSSLGTNLLALRPGSPKLRGVALEQGMFTRFTEQDAREILQKIPGVEEVAPSVSGRGQLTAGGKNWSTQILGTTPSYAKLRAAKPGTGRFFTEEEVRKRAKVAIVGMTPVRELFGGQNPVGRTLKINRISFTVIGVLPEKGASSWRDEDDVVVVPLSTAMRRVLGKDYLDSIDIQVRSAGQMERVQTSVSELIRRRHRVAVRDDEAFQIRNMAELQEALAATSKTLSMLLSAIAAISLLVGGIGIMNIMLVSVTERTREIGLRKALGASRQDILTQFMIEAVAVSMLGGCFGILLAWAVVEALARTAGWPAVLSLDTVLLALAFSAGVGVGFGLWPAWKASLLHPIEALRHE